MTVANSRVFVGRGSSIAVVTSLIAMFATLSHAVMGDYGTRDTGLSPLHDAAAAGDAKKVKLLIAQGADLYKRSSWGYHPILSAGQKGRVEIVKLMLDAGFDPNAKNPFGGTMLHAFVAYATPGATKVLIEYGAKVNAPD